MKIKYQEPTIVDRLEAAIEQARAEGRRIERFELTEPELTEFCQLGNLAYSKGCGYTYKHLKISYDGSSQNDVS